MFRVHTWGGIGDGGEGGLIWMRIHLAANQAAMTIQLPIETPPCIVSPRPRRMNICEQSPTTTGTALVQCDGFEHHRLERQMPRRSNVNNSTGRAVPNENISRRFLFCSPRDVRFAEVVANLRKFLNPVVCSKMLTEQQGGTVDECRIKSLSSASDVRYQTQVYRFVIIV